MTKLAINPRTGSDYGQYLPVGAAHVLAASPSPVNSPWLVQAAAATDGGANHYFNEDSVRVNAARGHAVIADGMGGDPAGRRASEWVCETLSALIEAAGQDSPSGAISAPPEDRLCDWIHQCAQGLREQTADLAGHPALGSTVAALWLSEGKALIAHVGDSRVYRLRSGVLSRLTRDHSMLEEDATTPAASVRRRPAAEPSFALLTQVLGIDDRVTPALRVDASRTGDLYLLCTDGLTTVISDLALASLLSQPSRPVSLLADDLIQAALGARGTDNISVIVLRLESVDENLGRRP